MINNNYEFETNAYRSFAGGGQAGVPWAILPFS
jgi:hypothetical protein